MTAHFNPAISRSPTSKRGIFRSAPARRGLSALALWAATAPAALALTPQDVLEMITGSLDGMGYETEVTTRSEGGALIVEEMVSTMVQEIADEEIVTTSTVGGFRLEPRGDDVALRIEGEMPVSTSSTVDDETSLMMMTFTSPDMESLVSGTPGDMRILTQASSATLNMDRMVMPDGMFMTDFLTVTFSDLDGDSRMTRGGLTTIDGNLRLGTLGLMLDMTLPDEDTGEPVHVTGSGSLSDLAGRSSMALPEGLAGQTMDFEKMFEAGYAADFSVNYGAGAFVMDAEGPDPFHFEETVGAGDLSVTLSEEGMGYDVSASDIALSLSAPMIPPGAGATIGRTAFSMKMPLAVTEEDKPMGLMLNLQDLALPEPLWALFDPTGKLPHDPMTVTLDIGAMGRMLHSFADMEEMEDMESPPGELTSLTLNSLLLRLGGAEVTAQGSFDIDNSAKSRINPGMPKFTGRVDATAQGVLGLVQTLAEMGLIPPQQAMSVPMMAGMFMRQLSGPDDLASTLEITGDEQVLVNGRPMMP